MGKLTLLGVNDVDIDLDKKIFQLLCKINPDIVAVEGHEKYVPLMYEESKRHLHYMASTFPASFNGNQDQKKSMADHFIHLAHIESGIFPWKTCQRYSELFKRELVYLDNEDVARKNLEGRVHDLQEYHKMMMDFSESLEEENPFDFTWKSFIDESDDFSKNVYALCLYDINSFIVDGYHVEDIGDDREFHIQLSRLLPADQQYREERLRSLVKGKKNAVCVVNFAQTLDDLSPERRTLYSCITDLEPVKFVAPYGGIEDGD